MSEQYTYETFRNGTSLKFIDISSEEWREYERSNGTITKIKNPIALNVSKSGGHRIFDGNGVSHYVTGGWIHLYWHVKDGQPHFVA